ncbi:MAG: hypothetical protein ABJI96_08350 [Paracoccaceae bacterium]
MRKFLTGLFSFGIAFFCVNAALAATVGFERSEYSAAERQSPFDGRESDGGVFFNGKRSEWSARLREIARREVDVEPAFAPLKKLVQLETPKKLRIAEWFEEGGVDLKSIVESTPVNTPGETDGTSGLSLAAVPIPSAIFLLGGGILVLIGFRRRQHLRA